MPGTGYGLGAGQKACTTGVLWRTGIDWKPSSQQDDLTRVSAPPTHRILCPGSPAQSSPVVRHPTHEREIVKTLRRIAPVAMLAALALGLSACDWIGPDDPEPTTPPVSIATPQAFDTQSPIWKPISDLPSGDGVQTAISSDGKHMAYAQRDSGAETITVGQVDLTSGEQSDPVSIDALAVSDTDGTDGNVSLFYSGNRLVAAHSGTSSQGQDQWSAALFSVGSSADPKVLSEDVESGESVKLPSEGTGAIVTASKGSGPGTAWLIDTETSSATKKSTEDTEHLSGCGDEANCDLALQPSVQYTNKTVSSFKENTMAGKTLCSPSITATEPDENSGFDHCLSGFRTDKWSSQDPEVAPGGTVAESAYIYASGGGYLVGAWRSDDGKIIYRTININEPGAGHAEVACDRPLTGAATNTLHSSPNGKYFAAGSVIFDVTNGDGACLDDEEATLTAVDNDGTAWGSTESVSSGDRYVSTAISATPNGEVTSQGGDVAIPASFVSTSGETAAIFAVSEDAVSGATAVAAYPQKS